METLNTVRRSPDLTERRLSRPLITLLRSSIDFSFFGTAIFEGIVDIRTLEVLFSLFLPPDGARQLFPAREPDRD